MRDRPFFSIVIPTFNRASNLELALFCILSQYFKNFEVVISDNCSFDNTFSIIKRFKDKRIKYVRTKKNVIHSLNIKNALKFAKGEYIFLHSDDDFLFENDALFQIVKKIKKYQAGYIRVSYACLTPEMDGIFYFKPNKRFVSDEYLEKLSDTLTVLSFITDSDHYFITGLIFKNQALAFEKIVSSEHASWIRLLFDGAKNYGAYFISNPLIIASWSKWRNKKDGCHPVYSLNKGKLESEVYFEVVEKLLPRLAFERFIHNQFISIYVRLFPLIKIKIGNKGLINFSNRIKEVDDRMDKDLRFWIYLRIACVVPGIFLKKLRDFYLWLYILTSAVKNKDKIILKLKNIELKYQEFKKERVKTFNFS
jgi:glycosyltransferase involved in cell wall biosynthesis